MQTQAVRKSHNILYGRTLGIKTELRDNPGNKRMIIDFEGLDQKGMPKFDVYFSEGSLEDFGKLDANDIRRLKQRASKYIQNKSTGYEYVNKTNVIQLEEMAPPQKLKKQNSGYEPIENENTNRSFGCMRLFRTWFKCERDED